MYLTIETFVLQFCRRVHKSHEKRPVPFLCIYSMSFRLEQRGCNWTDFRAILHWGFLVISLEYIKF
jgi:hypothetical protein